MPDVSEQQRLITERRRQPHIGAHFPRSPGTPGPRQNRFASNLAGAALRLSHDLQLDHSKVFELPSRFRIVPAGVSDKRL